MATRPGGCRSPGAASAVPVIPAPLTGRPFLKASPFQLGAERAQQPFSHTQSPPFWVHRPRPAPAPRSGQARSSAGAGGGAACSETRLALPERPLQPVAPVVPRESAVRMHADPRIRVLTSAMRESFPCPHAPPQRPPLPGGKDRIPRGDREKIRLPPSVHTFSYPAQPAARLRHSHGETPRKHLLISGSHFFTTTQQAEYQPPHQSQRVTADSKSHRESHKPFNYHNESFVTTTQAMLVPHRQQKQRLSKDKLQQMKSSHLGLPWEVQDLFRTEQRDEFTPKSRSPAEIQKANTHVSCVPLGTLKGYRPQKEVCFTP
ncbi:LOW QUALITY PROTEIN: stabilizer of axonemal microtubules 5 [Podargus strigoides]